MPDILLQLASHGGPVGAVLALVWLYVRQLHKELTETQNKRVEDAQSMISKLLDLNDKWNETISAQIEASEAQKQLLADLKQGLSSVQDNLHLRPRR